MQKGDKPKISVVLPVYNQANLISNSINSILNQTFKDFELIIIDDGSTDGIDWIMRKFQDSRIKYTYQEHQGLVKARNLGNFYAQADVIALQDADDLSMPDRLEKCYKEIKKGADVVYHGIYTNMWNKNFGCIARNYVSAPSFNKYKLLQGQYIPGACIFRKKCWDKKPFRLDTQYAFDYMMHLDWAFSGFGYKALDEGLYEYVRQENSASQLFEKDGRRQQSLNKIKEIVQREYGQEIGNLL